MNLSTACPSCGHSQDLSYAYWQHVSYETRCEKCGSEIVGFVVQQTVNWPTLPETTLRPRLSPVRTAQVQHMSLSDQAVQLLNAAVVWLNAPMSQDSSRLSWWLRSAR